MNRATRNWVTGKRTKLGFQLDPHLQEFEEAVFKLMGEAEKLDLDPYYVYVDAEGVFKFTWAKALTGRRFHLQDAKDGKDKDQNG